MWDNIWSRLQNRIQNNPNYSEQFRNQVGSAPNPFRPNPQPPQGTPHWSNGGGLPRPGTQTSGPPPFMMDAPVNPPQGTNGPSLGPPGGWRAANPNRPENRYSGPPPFMMDAPVNPPQGRPGQNYGGPPPFMMDAPVAAPSPLVPIMQSITALPGLNLDDEYERIKATQGVGAARAWQRQQMG